ncbi:uncharacterized protein LOC129719756 [Wyeomyia smithii]|uniref:uncharacterized protein LOC129719756 n=1 Tax=Wyeomyia smithii TaxID=174621 RepID=UPI002467FC21|nr:uncharacterized protein LOC129719756 [Wyeomyia smithii]
MEVPDPASAVEHFPPAFISRPGPACGLGERNFQIDICGKYEFVSNPSFVDALRVFSPPTTDLSLLDDQITDSRCHDSTLTTRRHLSSTDTSRFNVTPGRNDVGIMDAPYLPAAVEHFQPAATSRPGPACGCEGRSIQNLRSGKCANVNHRPSTDSLPVFSPSNNPKTNNVDHGHDILLYYQNVGAMNASVSDYLLACADSPYDIIVLTESWLDNRTLSRQIFGPNYEVFRCDRNPKNSRKTSGGGVLIAVHRQLNASILEHDVWSTAEQVWATIKLVDRTLFLCAIYVPPDRTRDTDFLRAHMSSVNTIISKTSAVDDVIILGDFNLPGITWQERGNGFMHADFGSLSLSPATTELLDSYSTATLQQCNRITNENGRFLDLCFATVRCQAPEVALAPSPLVKHVLHHPALLVSAHQKISCAETTAPTSVYYDFARADFENNNVLLFEIDWNTVLDTDDVNAAALTFSHILNYVIDRHVQKKTNSDQQRLPWLNTTLRRLKSERKAALRRFSKYRTLPLRNHYLSINTRYKQLSRSCFRGFLRNVERKLKRNPKSFWKYVNEQRKDGGLPSSMFLDGDTANSV